MALQAEHSDERGAECSGNSLTKNVPECPVKIFSIMCFMTLVAKTCGKSEINYDVLFDFKSPQLILLFGGDDFNWTSTLTFLHV